ncbi:MAG: glucoamylase family protein [Microbacter sp.]
MRTYLFLVFSCVLLLVGCSKTSSTQPSEPIVYNSLSIVKATVNGSVVTNGSVVYNVANQPVSVQLTFNRPLVSDPNLKNFVAFSGSLGTNYQSTFLAHDSVLSIVSSSSLNPITRYSFQVNPGQFLGGQLASAFSFSFVSQIDSTAKFPVISDDSLLSVIQRATFRYFWDYAHPVSGLARERIGSGETVTIGGSGFGIMAILVAIHRGFITRAQGFAQLNKIVTFLSNAQTFHGAFPHWMNGSTGAVIPFSATDNGGDLVETAYMMEGLLTAYQFFKNGSSDEQAMCGVIQKLWQNVDWTWYQNGQNTLYWHWSPTYGWNGFPLNMQINGYNEAMITYILAASSPTHPITKAVYDQGWAQNGAIRNGHVFEGITLPLGVDYGGPLFFAHYSYLGLDPRNLQDQYANYWQQNVAQTKINNLYCIQNPKGWDGYSPQCWGLTASDSPTGYNAASPTNDQGTIAPTAALSSMPYTPTQSMQAARFFYYQLGDKIWGQYGFVDAFDLSQAWFSTDANGNQSDLAIDEGPIIIMIENYRSHFLWDLFMQNSDVQSGLTKLGFMY